MFITGHSWSPPQQCLHAHVEAELLKAAEFLASSIKSLFIGCKTKSYAGEKNTYLQTQLGSRDPGEHLNCFTYLII